MAGYNERIGGGGFHHVAMRARNFDATVKFYTEGLGFKKSISWGEAGNRTIMLDTGEGNYIEVFEIPTKGKKAIPQGMLLHMAFKTNDCDAATANARAAGAEITMEPSDVDIKSEPPTNVRIAFCKGPDGEVIEFFQYR
jgi:glyoxylase I family protein